MNLHWIDIGIIVTYLIVVAIIGFWVKNRATAGLDNYYLAGRNIPWWLLGFAGCSSYIDIGGTMAMVGALFFLGLKSVWMTHIFWGWFIIAGYMAFQAKWIRRSGVMTFAEWNQTRFGNNRDAEMARIASAAFLLLLMIFNLIYIAVGIGKFAEEFLPFSRLGSTLIVFSIVGIYVTLAGMIGVIITDIIQTILIAFGAVFLTFLAFSIGAGSNITDLASNGWRSLEPTWTLWSGFLESTPDSYHHFYFFGPLMMAGFGWMLFRVLAGPNVWDFQFFLTARSPRDAALAGGMWTVGYTMRWFIGVAFLVLGMHYLNLDSGVEPAIINEPATLTLGESTTQSLPVEPSLEPSAIPMSDTKSFDSEKIIPRVLSRLPIGIRGLFMAVLLAALMSTLDAMINITSSVVVNDFLKRYFLKKLKEKQLVRLGQLASLVALLLGLVFSISFEDIISIWEMMVLVVVTMILVPSTMRWHWWRFSARAFVLSMVTSAAMIVFLLVFFPNQSASAALATRVGVCLAVTLVIGFLCKPTDMEILVSFYARVRPFGFWGPVHREAIRRRLIPASDRTAITDAANGLLTAVFQFSLALVPFYLFLRDWSGVFRWLSVIAVLGIILYFTWFKTLPARDEV